MISLSRARTLGVAGITALGLGAAGSLVEASVSLGAAPTTGAACQSADGKINARGSTLQSWLQEDTIGAYASDVCGYVGAAPIQTSGTGTDGNVQDQNGLYFQNPFGPTNNATSSTGKATEVDADPTDPFTSSAETSPNAAPFISSGTAGDTEPYYKSDYMVSYNPYQDYNYSATGSSQGRVGISCRTDSFTGTDIPYVYQDWEDINGTAGTEANSLGSACQLPESKATDLTYIGTTKPVWQPPFIAVPGTGFGTGNTSDPTGANNPVYFGGSAQGGALLSFPIGISAAAFPINLQTGVNGNGKPLYCGTYGSTTAGTTTLPSVKLTAADVAALMGGVISNWEQLDSSYTFDGTVYNDAGENPSLAACNLNVVRVVRADGSGTTQAVLNFLNDASGGTSAAVSTLATCNANGSAGNVGAGLNETFGQMAGQIVTSTSQGHVAGANTFWPGANMNSISPTSSSYVKPEFTLANNGCTEVIPGGATSVNGTGVNGGPALLQTLENYSQTDTTGTSQTAGAIGYADISDVEHDLGTSTLTIPTIEESNSPSLSSGLGYVGSGTSKTTYAAPKVTGGNGSNCTATVNLPNGAGDLGLNGEWALDYGSPGTLNPGNFDDISWKSEAAYPACTLTWDFVWGNQASGDLVNQNASGTGSLQDPQPEVDADQVRTLYSYFTYIFSDAAQSTFANAGYTQLPQSDIDNLRQEFQAAF